MFFDEVRDMDLKTALLQPMDFFVQLKNLIPNAKDKNLISKSHYGWTLSQLY